MAPTKVKAGSAKGNNKRNTKPDSSGSSSKSKSKAKPSSNSKVQKLTAKQKAARAKRNGGRTHRDIKESELDVQKLNMITPIGVQKPRGKKKGKVFVDDKEGMMTILAMVNAEKEGQIESKMMKERQMEEIRQARQQEMEARAAEKKSKMVGLRYVLTFARMYADSIYRMRPRRRFVRIRSIQMPSLQRRNPSQLRRRRRSRGSASRSDDFRVADSTAQLSLALLRIERQRFV